MARIRAKNTAPEVNLRKALWSKGLRYRLQIKIDGTRPDIVFRSRRLIVFVDGCFWHGCPLHYLRPRTRPEFWAGKLADNTARDRSQTIRLIENGWSVLRIWEHEVDEELQRVVEDVVIAHCQPPTIFRNRAIVTRVEEAGADMERWHIEELVGDGEKFSEIRLRRSR